MSLQHQLRLAPLVLGLSGARLTRPSALVAPPGRPLPFTGFQRSSPGRVGIRTPADSGTAKLTRKGLFSRLVGSTLYGGFFQCAKGNMARAPLPFSFSSTYLTHLLLSGLKFKDGIAGDLCRPLHSALLFSPYFYSPLLLTFYHTLLCLTAN